MKDFIYKSREEKLLIKKLTDTKLISESQLIEIKKLYSTEVPYHNFLHALKVAEGVLKLPNSTYNITEIKSLFISALFHDAGHKGVAEDLDEFRSLNMAFQGIMDFEERYDYTGIDYSIVRKSIIGTVFKNRGKNTDPYAILLADLDVSTIGMSFPEFLYYADFPFCIECGVEIKDWIQDVEFFKFLMRINKNIFLCPETRKLFPAYLKNIKKYTQTSEDIFKKLFHKWRNSDMTFLEFQDFYNKMT